MELHEKFRDLLPDCPRIIDPANLANNLYHSGVKRSDEKNRWSPFARKIVHLNLCADIMGTHTDCFKHKV